MTITEHLLKEDTLPKSWQIKKIEDVCTVILGQSPPSSSYNFEGKGLPFFQGKAEFGKLHPRVTKWCIEPKKISQKNDVLISVRAPVGPTNLSPLECCIGRGLAALRTKDGVHFKYLLFYLRSIVSFLESQGTGTTFKAISGAILKNIPFPLAPSKEQSRIVYEIDKQFSRIDKAVDNLKKIQSNLNRYKASVFKAAVEGNLTEKWRKANPIKESASQLLKSEKKKSINSPFDAMPEGWICTTVDTLIQYVTSGSRGWAKYYSETGDIFIRAQNLKNDRLELDDVAFVNLPENAEGKRTRIQKNDILITITGANVTKAAIVNSDLEQKAYVNQHIALVRPYSEDVSEYLYLWLTCPGYGRRILEKAAYGAGKPGLNLTNIKEVIVALPPLQEQKQILSEIKRNLSIYDRQNEHVDKALTRAEILRQSILKKAFTGRLVPQIEVEQQIA